jgi:cob(I)alamin adenosyltransferase
VKIYTRTGDAGQTGLIGGARVAKDSLQMAAIGDVDELNAVIGVGTISISDPVLRQEMAKIQCRLFDLGAELAGGAAGISEEDIRDLEASIDRQTAVLPALKNFILPGGSPSGAALHLARTVCRRAERSVFALSHGQPISSDSKTFLNRLSDWLFTAARTTNALSSVSDVEWHAKESR